MKYLLPVLMIVIAGCAGKGHVYKHITPKENLKLCFIGDTGTGYPVQKRVADKLEEEKCHSIHFLGDIIYRNGISTSRDKQFREKFFDYYYHLSEKDFRPRLYIILGNHDHRGSVKAWQELSEKHKNIIFPNPWYLVKMNNLCLVHLDTDYYKLFWKLPMGWEQKSWLEFIAEEELKSCDMKVALTHHPYESRGLDHGPARGMIRNFLKDYVIGKYDYLLSGHEHILSDEGTLEGTRLLISGAGGNPDKNENPGFLVMFWNEKSKTLTYEFRRLTK